MDDSVPLDTSQAIIDNLMHEGSNPRLADLQQLGHAIAEIVNGNPELVDSTVSLMTAG